MDAAAVDSVVDAAFIGEKEGETVYARAASIAASDCATSMGAASADSDVDAALSGDKERDAA